ncbi:hypothetical protein [Halobacterium yunchengense]|uniref:hypothetical protein n=1 Tax=Halobacterium yunchengense TaxID=3108497 RepID=UPI00300A18FA
MPEPTYDEDLERFRESVEEKVGQEIHPDTAMGDHICWFFLNIPVELNGETFDAEVDFDLSEDGVEPMYAEIYVESGTDREEKLSEVGTRLEAGDEALYEYYLDEDEVGDVMADLREAHAEVYG